MVNKYFYLIISFVLISFAGYAKDLPPKPNDKPIVDLADWLNAAEEQELANILKGYEDSTSNQIAVCIEPELYGEDVFDRSFAIAEYWQIGQKGKNNGILLYFAAKERKIFVQVGRGLEGAVPDISAGKIVREIASPHFKKGQYFIGIKESCIKIMQLASGEFQADGEKIINNFPKGVFIFILLFIILAIIIGSKSNGGGGRNIILGGGPWIGGGFGGGFGGGGFGGGSSGGGGWGGFGGGSFGGGGAGGDW